MTSIEVNTMTVICTGVIHESVIITILQPNTIVEVAKASVVGESIVVAPPGEEDTNMVIVYTCII